MNDNSVIIAITGGLASGKTTVAKLIEEKGFPVIYTDVLAKKIMNGDEQVKRKITEEFGEQSYSEDGKLNANYIANIVFNSIDDQQIEKLNKIVHPPTIDLMIAEIENAVKSGKKYIFVESALIYEASLDEGFDYIICVACERDTQIKRAMKRNNIDKKSVEDRLDKQISLKAKADLADFVINNDDTLESLKATTEFILSIVSMLEPKEK